MDISEFARKGGLAAAVALSDAARKARASRAVKAYWSRLSPKQRSAEMKRRAARRKVRKPGRKED